MRRAALSSLIVLPMFGVLLAAGVCIAEAADCPNKWNEPIEVTSKGDRESDATREFTEKSRSLAKDAKCGDNQCAKDKGVCRAMQTTTRACTGDSMRGWTCTGNVRVGCFCLGAGEEGHTAPGRTAKPANVECSNKFGDPKEVITVEKNQETAEKLQRDKIQEAIDQAAETCAEEKCAGASQSCRLYYTTAGDLSRPVANAAWHCKTRIRTGCFCLGKDEAALALATPAGATTGGELAAATRPYRGKTVLVGIVLAEGCAPGRTCTASLVSNPDEVAGASGLVVRKVNVPERRDARGHATLQGVVVSSNTAEHQPADGPITFTTPETGAASALALEVALADTPDEVESVPVGDLPPSQRRPTEEASAPPVLPDNGVCVVHDKFSGDGHATEVKVNGTDVRVLAESEDLAAFKPGNAAKAGDNEYTITDSGVTKTYKLASPSVSITASQTTLEQNQSAQFQVTVSEIAGIPESSWLSAGAAGAVKLGGAAPMGGRGYILLTIKNDSPSTTTITGGNLITVPIYESDVSDGRYTYNGTITAQQPGPFQLEASIEAHLAEAPPIAVAHAAGSPR